MGDNGAGGSPQLGRDQLRSILEGSMQAGDQGLTRLLSWEGRKGRPLWHRLVHLIPRHLLAKWPQLGRDCPPLLG